MGASIKVTSGPAVERASDIASILTGLQPNDVLFIDEIHRLNRAVEEVMYSAMEDFFLSWVVGKGLSAQQHQSAYQPLYAGGRDYPLFAGQRALARPLRLRVPAGLLQRCGYDDGSATFRIHSGD